MSSRRTGFEVRDNMENFLKLQRRTRKPVMSRKVGNICYLNKHY